MKKPVKSMQRNIKNRLRAKMNKYCTSRPRQRATTTGRIQAKNASEILTSEFLFLFCSRVFFWSKWFNIILFKIVNNVFQKSTKGIMNHAILLSQLNNSTDNKQQQP